jgi:hypothetical protein
MPAAWQSQFRGILGDDTRYAAPMLGTSAPGF